jgi:hypothetical protein
MAKDTKNAIFINNVEYDHESLTDEQKILFSHCVDLDRKIASAQFNLDQLSVGKDAFIKMLEESLAKTDEPIAE